MGYRISIICSDAMHPVNPWLERWKAEHGADHDVRILRDVAEADGGDFLFLISCHQIVRAEVRDRYRHTLVIHASALPQGRGMSPHVWQILEGRNRIPVTLLNAEDAVDSGDIWAQEVLDLEGHELHDEIHARLFDAELRLMRWAIANCDRASPRKQVGEESLYPRRKPQDSRIDPTKPLIESFNLLRIADPNRYPAFFEARGHKYKITIEKMPQ
jgi:methionyl-tRNA formyltransferase